MEINNHHVQFDLIHPLNMTPDEVVIRIEFNSHPESLYIDDNVIYVDPLPGSDVLLKIERLSGRSFSELDEEETVAIVEAVCDTYEG